MARRDPAGLAGGVRGIGPGIVLEAIKIFLSGRRRSVSADSTRVVKLMAQPPG